jgi:hypothetical protein
MVWCLGAALFGLSTRRITKQVAVVVVAMVAAVGDAVAVVHVVASDAAASEVFVEMSETHGCALFLANEFSCVAVRIGPFDKICSSSRINTHTSHGATVSFTPTSFAEAACKDSSPRRLRQ